jgi:hypothetical protein
LFLLIAFGWFWTGSFQFQMLMMKEPGDGSNGNQFPKFLLNMMVSIDGIPIGKFISDLPWIG